MLLLMQYKCSIYRRRAILNQYRPCRLDVLHSAPYHALLLTVTVGPSGVIWFLAFAAGRTVLLFIVYAVGFDEEGRAGVVA